MNDQNIIPVTNHAETVGEVMAGGSISEYLGIIPKALTYKEAAAAMAEGKTVLCKPKGESSFLVSSMLQLKRFSRTSKLEELEKFSYRLIT